MQKVIPKSSISTVKDGQPDRRPSSRLSEQSESLSKLRNDKVLDERALKSIATQGVDETKRKLEKEIQMM